MDFSGEKIIDGHPNPEYVVWLESQLMVYRQTIGELRRQVSRFHTEQNRRYRHEADFLTYEEEP